MSLLYPHKGEEAVLPLLWEGRRGSVGELEAGGGSLPRLTDHAKVLTLPSPPSRHSYPEAGTKPHE